MQLHKKAIISYAAAVLTLCSCSQDNFRWLDGKSGHIELSVAADKTIGQPKARGAEDTDLTALESLTAQDLAIVLQSTEGESYSRRWESISAFPAEEGFPAGSYMCTAYYGEADDNGNFLEGFDRPVLFGTADFQVIAEESVQVDLTAKVVNSIVSIELTDNFKDYFQSYALDVESSSGRTINIGSGETRPVYINPGLVHLTADVTLPSGQPATLSLCDFTAKVATLQHITIDIQNKGTGDDDPNKPSEPVDMSGDVVLVVKFDETMIDTDVRIDLSEELFNASAPEMKLEGFADGESFEYVEGEFDKSQCVVNIAAQAGLSAATLTIGSNEYNLLGESAELLSGLGIKTINFTADSKFAKINLRDYLANIACADMFSSRNTPVSLSITDRLNNTETISLTSVVTPKPVLEIKPLIKETRGDTYLLMAPSYQVEVISNMGSADDPGIEWSVVDSDNNEFDKPEFTTGDHPGEFIFNFKTPEEASDFAIKAADMTWDIHVPHFTIKPIEEADVWATHTHFTVEPKDEADRDILKGITIEGAAATARQGDALTYDLTGLTPGTKYELAASLGEEGFLKETFGFTTEADLGVPNGDFEELEDEINSQQFIGGAWSISSGYNYVSGSKYKISKPKHWATVNNKTANTSYKVTNVDYVYSYTKVLGFGGIKVSSIVDSRPEASSWFTVPSTFNSTLEFTSDVPAIRVTNTGGKTGTPNEYSGFIAKNGTNAMVIRNVSWDKNGTAPNLYLKTEGASELEGTNHYNHNIPSIANNSSGKLFLGSYNYNIETGTETYNEGIPFTSRPSYLSGYFTYKTDVSDQDETGIITLKILSNGIVIGEAHYSFTSTDDYKQFTAPIIYNNQKGKATDLCIMIASSNHADNTSQDNETKNIKTTAITYTLECTKIGATLVVDNLTFEY